MPDENRLDRWCLGEWEPKIRLGENLVIELEIGEPWQGRTELFREKKDEELVSYLIVSDD